MSISDGDVRHISALARVGLTDARIPSLVRELNGILEHMDVLQQVALVDDAAEGGPRTDVPAMPLRPDAQPPDALRREREVFAPLMRDGFFLVPRLATHGALGASAGDVDLGDNE